MSQRLRVGRHDSRITTEHGRSPFRPLEASSRLLAMPLSVIASSMSRTLSSNRRRAFPRRSLILRDVRALIWGWATVSKYSGPALLFAVSACDAAEAPQEPLRTFPEPPEIVFREEAPAPPCPDGTVLVEGDSYPVAVRTCLEGDPYRCRRFSGKVRLIGEPTRLRFCIDVHEHPNREGATPEVGMTWHEARSSCEKEGKRLCTEDEWTLACEGPERNPYPTGLDRDPGACNIDRPWIRPDNAKLNGPDRQGELDRLSQSVPSGSLGCVSHYGVRDMTGNVDEWVENRTGRKYRSGLKGGWWGPVRNRCRPITLFHNEWHHGYQIGTRCCSDPHVGPPGRVPDAKE